MWSTAESRPSRTAAAVWTSVAERWQSAGEPAPVRCIQPFPGPGTCGPRKIRNSVPIFTRNPNSVSFRELRAMIALFSTSVATKLLPHGVPSNFWLLRTPGIASADEDALVGAYVARLKVRVIRRRRPPAAERRNVLGRRGCRAADRRRIRAAGAGGSPSRVACDGAVAEEIGSPHRTFLLPGAFRRGPTVDDARLRPRRPRRAPPPRRSGCRSGCASSPPRSRSKRCSRSAVCCGLDGIAAALAGAEAVALTEVALEAADDAAARRARPSLAAAPSSRTSRRGRRALRRRRRRHRPRRGDWVDALDGVQPAAARSRLEVGADLDPQDEKYSLNALAAAVSAHTERGGVAQMM